MRKLFLVLRQVHAQDRTGGCWLLLHCLRNGPLFSPGVIFKRQEIFLHHRFNACKFFLLHSLCRQFFLNSPNFPLCRQFISAIFLVQTIYFSNFSHADNFFPIEIPPPPPWKIMVRPSSGTLYQCINLFDHTVNLAFLSSK